MWYMAHGWSSGSGSGVLAIRLCRSDRRCCCRTCPLVCHLVSPWVLVFPRVPCIVSSLACGICDFLPIELTALVVIAEVNGEGTQFFTVFRTAATYQLNLLELLFEFRRASAIALYCQGICRQFERYEVLPESSFSFGLFSFFRLEALQRLSGRCVWTLAGLVSRFAADEAFSFVVCFHLCFIPHFLLWTYAFSCPCACCR